MKYYAKVEDQEFIIEIGHENQIMVNDEPYEIDFQKMPDSGVTSLIIGNRSLEAVVEDKDGSWQVLIRGDLYDVQVEDERSRRLASARGDLQDADGEIVMRSPMPGIVIAVSVRKGQTIRKGDKVIILESMKMENELRAPRDGTITQVSVEPGVSVEKDQILVVISDEHSS
jgi:biotin carboxyl carrier protein